MDKYIIKNYKKKKTYCITIPPPNITGILHIGHAFQCTLMDILIRYYKMNQFLTLWKMGTDHAGIASQIIIELKIKNKNIKKKNAYVRKWKNKSIKKIQNQLKKQEFLLNWKTARFTLDKHFSYAVKYAFQNLYKKKLIYKEKKLINWDSKLQTAISDLEITHKEEITELFYIKYKLQNTTKFIIIATTRPETIFADTAIAINPKDDRYLYALNKKAIIPIINKIIPVITSDSVKINFGTGCLKVTPGHDFNDFEIGKKHKLKTINILNKNGSLNKNVPKIYQNIKITKARQDIKKELLKSKIIQKIEIYKNKIPISDRSFQIIEPFITKQWFLKTKPLIKPVEHIIKNKKLKIIPQKWKHVFLNWIKNIKDWCISRQIWWGHRLPIWYDKDKNEYIGENEKTIKRKYKLNNKTKISQDSNVLDTWFSSALWPFASLGWPKNTIEYKTFYPTNILITGFDIIFFWVIRMIMLGIEFTKKIPFKEIYIHGLIKDNLGNKMSKTKGNVIDPFDIINGISLKNLIKKQTSHLFNKTIKEQIIHQTKKQFPNGIEAFGIDAVRLTFTSLATSNMSITLNLEKFKKYKNFCNKIHNAGIFINKYSQKVTIKNNKNTWTNKWILSLWQKTKKHIIKSILFKNFQLTNELIYNFTWIDFCNTYIEIIKITKNDIYLKFNNKTLKLIFNEILQTLHPISPIITNKIWRNINKTDKDIINSKYPKINKNIIKQNLEQISNIFKELQKKIRNNKINNYLTIKTNIKYIKIIENFKNILIKSTYIKGIYFISN